ncbi:MAG: hypothetical protein ACIWVG_17970, partial [Gloeotrichia echinulata HAB0833]
MFELNILQEAKIMEFRLDYLEELEDLEIPYHLSSYLSSGSLSRWTQDELTSGLRRFGNDDNDLFQILTIDEIDGEFTINLVYGRKEYFRNHYPGVDTDKLPTKGTKVKQEFVKTSKYKYPTIRFLLQSRKLSQMMASTWLDLGKLNLQEYTSSFFKKVKCVKKIFGSYNIAPDTFYEFSGENENHESRMTMTNLTRLLLNNQEHTDWLIKPGSLGYSSISLALLLCGQAYYRTTDESGNKKWEIIWESIFSTYEMIWEYALELSWDTFYATRKDVSQSMGKPRPPFTQVTLGYPPRPSEFNLDEESIQDWAFAKDEEHP